MNDITKQDVNHVQEFIAKALEILPKDDADKENREYFEGNLEAIETAKKNLEDNPKNEQEKLTYLYDACIKWATQLAFLLFRREALGGEVEKEFRALETPEESTERVKVYMAKDEEARNEAEAPMNAYNAKDVDLQIFKAVIGGMTPEEAKQKFEEYEARVKAAQQNQA